MLKRKLAMLELQEQQALMGAMGQGGAGQGGMGAGAPTGARPTGIVPGVP